MASTLVNAHFADRNDVMHGRKCDYDKAKLSVTLLLTASILASLFAQLEK